MSERTRLGLAILAAALMLGILGDLLLRATPWGLNVLLWTALLTYALNGLIGHKPGVTVRCGKWAILPVLAFATMFAWRDSSVLKGLDAAGLLIALAMASLCARSLWLPFVGAVEYGVGVGWSALTACIGLAPLIRRDIQWRELPRGRWVDHGKALGRGLLIAVPLLLIFGGLFAAADAVFARRMSDAFNIDTDALSRHLIFTGLFAWVAGGLIRSAIFGEDARIDKAGMRRPVTLGIVEVATVLGLMDLLFLGFVVIQIRYLFGGAPLIRETIGMTYSQYARRGFFELVAVSVLTLPILLHAHWLLGDAGRRAERLFRILAGAQVALVFVVMASAIQRMRLYQAEFGQTELRFYTSAFIGWLAVVFLWFAATVLTGRRKRFALGAIASCLVAVIALHAVNPDARIVQANAAREGRRFDVAYNTSLSADSVPALIDSLPALTPSDRAAISARLTRRWMPHGPLDWRTWSYARDTAYETVAGSIRLLAADSPIVYRQSSIVIPIGDLPPTRGTSPQRSASRPPDSAHP